MLGGDEVVVLFIPLQVIGRAGSGHPGLQIVAVLNENQSGTAVQVKGKRLLEIAGP